MRIPGQTTSRPPPAIFKVDVSCGARPLPLFSFLSLFSPRLFPICGSFLCRGSPLFLSMFGHYLCSCTRACIGEPLSWSRYDRSLNTNYPVRLFCGFARYRSHHDTLSCIARQNSPASLLYRDTSCISGILRDAHYISFRSRYSLTTKSTDTKYYDINQVQGR